MIQRIIVSTFTIVSLVSILIGYLLLHPWLLNLCAQSAYCLDDSIDYGIGDPLYFSTYLLPPLFLILFFVRKEVFMIWLKIIPWFAVPALVLIVISPPLPEFLTPDRTEMTDMMVKLIVAVSAVVIIWKYATLRKGTYNKAK